MITKNPEEIKILRQGGKILADTLKLIGSKVGPGVSAFELDQIAEKEVSNRGAESSFKNYPKNSANPFPASLCVSVNDEVVHGIPTKEKILKEGDIVGLDLGVKFKGLFTDAALTVPVGNIEPRLINLITVARHCLENALTQVKPGNYIGDLSFAIQETAENAGFSVVRELVGHGVGKSVHEDPEIPCFGKPHSGKKLVSGMVLAIEPMINMGGWKVFFENDHWTVKTADLSPSAHFEHTVLVTNEGCEILTRS